MQSKKALEIKMEAVTQWINTLEEHKKTCAYTFQEELIDFQTDLLADYKQILEDRLDAVKKRIQ